MGGRDRRGLRHWRSTSCCPRRSCADTSTRTSPRMSDAAEGAWRMDDESAQRVRRARRTSERGQVHARQRARRHEGRDRLRQAADHAASPARDRRHRGRPGRARRHARAAQAARRARRGAQPLGAHGARGRRRRRAWSSTPRSRSAAATAGSPRTSPHRRAAKVLVLTKADLPTSIEMERRIAAAAALAPFDDVVVVSAIERLQPRRLHRPSSRGCSRRARGTSLATWRPTRPSRS